MARSAILIEGTYDPALFRTEQRDRMTEFFQRGPLTDSLESSIIPKRDITVMRPLGAKATVSDDDEIYVPNSRQPAYFVSGEVIKNVEAFAGKGTKTPIRKCYDLADYYKGTDPNDWEKVKGIARVTFLGEEHTAEIHWYHEDSYGGVEYKVKPQKGGGLWLDEG